MRARLKPLSLLSWALMATVAGSAGWPQTAFAGPSAEQQRLDELKTMKRDMLRMMREYEARIARLEAEMKRRSGKFRRSRQRMPYPLHPSPR